MLRWVMEINQTENRTENQENPKPKTGKVGNNLRTFSNTMGPPAVAPTVGAAASAQAIVGSSAHSASSFSSLSSSNSMKGFFWCTILALQFGLQPIISTKFHKHRPISRSSIVVATELGKICMALSEFVTCSPEERAKWGNGWTLTSSLKVAAVPATLYAVQNLLNQNAKLALDAMTYNLMNQTKILSTALWCYVLLGQPQTGIQIGALLMLLTAAVLLNVDFSGASGGVGGGGGDIGVQADQIGLTCVLGASALSGLSAALTQKALQSQDKSTARPALLFTTELAIYGIIFLILREAYEHGGIREPLADLFTFRGWTLLDFVPVLTDGVGGVATGLVTKYAGGVRKGFALIVGILVTVLSKWVLHADGDAPTSQTWAALALVSISVALHSKFSVAREAREIADLKGKDKND